jgi:hypothetical protein
MFKSLPIWSGDFVIYTPTLIFAAACAGLRRNKLKNFIHALFIYF